MKPGSKFVTGVNDTSGNLLEEYQIAYTLKWTWRKNFMYGTIC